MKFDSYFFTYFNERIKTTKRLVTWEIRISILLKLNQNKR